MTSTKTETTRRIENARAWAAGLALWGLSLLAVAQTTTLTREVQYGYNAATGLLEWERVDPNQPHCSETIYEHDEYGNRKKVRVKPCTAGASNNVATAVEAGVRRARHRQLASTLW